MVSVMGVARAVVLLMFVGCRFDLPELVGCGDGKFDLSEECEDGNSLEGDGCDNNCTFTRCGNGVRTSDEECDAGPMNSNNGVCLENCHLARCGDEHVRVGVEGCDDGNAITETCPYGQTSCTVCDATCNIVPGATLRCGDGILQSPPEACDDGNSSSCGTCNASCSTLQPGGNCPLGMGCRFDADCASSLCSPTVRVCQ
jgi:cysteine-rich repeat protein